MTMIVWGNIELRDDDCLTKTQDSAILSYYCIGSEICPVLVVIKIIGEVFCFEWKLQANGGCNYDGPKAA